MRLNNRELAAVLAGLRLLQHSIVAEGYNNLPDAIDDIFQDGGTLKPLALAEIDELYGRLNTGMNSTVDGGMIAIGGGQSYALDLAVAVHRDRRRDGDAHPVAGTVPEGMVRGDDDRRLGAGDPVLAGRDRDGADPLADASSRPLKP
jgi:hypothetical protein